MKKLLLLLLTNLSSQAQAATLVSGGGIINGVAYSITNVNDEGTNGLESASNSGNVAVFTFNQAVDLTITNNDYNRTVLFEDNQGPALANSNVFTADAGNWSFTTGTSTTAPTTSSSGSTFTFGSVAGNASSGAGRPSQDWGSLTISGITTLTWTTANESFFESFRFDAVETIPEPTFTALLGLTGLFLVRRRERS